MFIRFLKCSSHEEKKIFFILHIYFTYSIATIPLFGTYDCSYIFSSIQGMHEIIKTDNEG